MFVLSLCFLWICKSNLGHACVCTCVFVNVYIHAYAFRCISVHMHIYARVLVSAWMCECMHCTWGVFVQMNAYMSKCTCVCKQACMYLYKCVFRCACTHTCICICACVPRLHFMDNSSCLVVMGTTVLKMLNWIPLHVGQKNQKGERELNNRHIWGLKAEAENHGLVKNWTGTNQPEVCPTRGAPGLGSGPQSRFFPSPSWPFPSFMLSNHLPSFLSPFSFPLLLLGLRPFCFWPISQHNN